MPAQYKYCSKCGERLVRREMFIGYNRYHGREETALFDTCPQLLETHDRWEINEPKGSWSDIGEILLSPH